MGDLKSEHRRYRALQEEFRQSEGFRLYHDFLAIRLTFYAFQTNYDELDCLIRQHYKLSLEHKLGDFYDRVPLDSLLVELTRRLHNFAFAAKSLIEHTRHFIVRSYGEESAIRAEYDAKVATSFGPSGIAAFTSGLRNFFGHVTSPFITSVMAGSDPAPGEPRYRLQLNTADMDRQPRWKGWSAGARKYISAHGYDVDLGIYATEYYEAVMRFYYWLGERNEQWCKDAWDHMIALQDQIQAYEERWGFPADRPKRLS